MTAPVVFNGSYNYNVNLNMHFECVCVIFLYLILRVLNRDHVHTGMQMQP